MWTGRDFQAALKQEVRMGGGYLNRIICMSVSKKDKQMDRGAVKVD